MSRFSANTAPAAKSSTLCIGFEAAAQARIERSRAYYGGNHKV